MKLQLALRVTFYLLGTLLARVGGLREFSSEVPRLSSVVIPLTVVAVTPDTVPLFARLMMAERGRTRSRNKPVYLKGALEICCATVRLL